MSLTHCKTRARSNTEYYEDHGWIPGQGEAPKARGRAFQLTIEEARATPNVVTVMFSCIILSVVLWYAYFYDYIRYLFNELVAYAFVF